MPNLFESLDSALAGSQVNASVTLEAEHLTGIVTTVGELISDPPQDYQNFLDVLVQMPLPDLDVSVNLSTQFEDLADLIPENLGDLTASLDDVIASVGVRISNELAGPLLDVIEAVQSVHSLIAGDLTCGLADAVSPTGGAAGDDGNGDIGTGGNGGAGTAATPAAGSLGGAPGPSETDIDRANTLLDLLPEPLTVEGLLHWLHDVLGTSLPPRFMLRAFPVLDDIRDPLDTLITWEQGDAAALLAHLQASLQSVTGFIEQSISNSIDAPFSELTALSGQWEDAARAQIADTLTTGLQTLAAAITAGELSGTAASVTDLNAALDQLDTIAPGFDVNLHDALLRLSARTESLDEMLEDGMQHMVSVLQPGMRLGRLAQFGDWPELTEVFDIGTLPTPLDSITEWLREVVDLVDVTAVAEPLSTAAQSLRDAVDVVDEAMVATTLAISEQFDGANEVLDTLDTSTLVSEAESAINDFRDELLAAITEAFAPVTAALSQAVATIDAATNQFDPAAIVAELESTLASLAAVFEDPAVTEALDTIRDTLDTVAASLESLSFAPLTDAVIDGIEEVGAALKSIDTTDLADALKGALQAALKVLPDDLRPLTDPMIDGFGELMATGPLPLLDSLQDQPQHLFDQVRAFEPTALLGDVLSAPFDDVIGELEAFQPSSLLTPIEAEFETFRQRLRNDADPAQAIAPLEALHAQLVSRLASLQPGALVQPLEAKLQSVLNAAIEALPAEELGDLLAAVVDVLQEKLGTAERLQELFVRVRDMTAGFANAGVQLDTWIDSILARVDALADTSSLNAALGDLAGAVDSSTAGALKLRVEANVAPLAAMLEALDPAARLAAVAQAAFGVSRSALDALPDTPDKTAVVAVLDRFDAATPDFNAALATLAQLQQALAMAPVVVASATMDWDARLHAQGGVLDCFREATAPTAQLRVWIDEGLEAQFHQPLRAVFFVLEQMQSLLAGLLAEFEPILAELQGKIASLITGPDGLAGIRDSVNALVERLQAVNLSFLTEGIDEIFATLTVKLDGAGPGPLRDALSSAFGDMLDALSLDAAIPEGSLAQVDSDYAQVLERLRALDPGTLLTDVVQPTYDAQLGAIIETFDITPLLESLVGTLGAMEDDLRSEMDRVNSAYSDMLRCVPDLDVSVDISVGF